MNNTNSIQSTENVVSLNQKISNNKINKSKEKKSKKIDKSIDSLESIKTIGVDEVFINLKIFSRIKKYDKLCFSGEALEIDTRYAIFIRRWLSNDDRARTISYINAIIDRVFTIVDTTYINEKNEISTKKKDESPFKEENSNLLQRFSIELGNTITGLQNLKITYKEDSLVKSQLDLVIDKIKIRIDKINKLLKIYV
tara:strand:+ start:1077 stop:1667 length:591 start_codon:yes stop_codon:yes gene_type:complete